MYVFLTPLTVFLIAKREFERYLAFGLNEFYCMHTHFQILLIFSHKKSLKGNLLSILNYKGIYNTEEVAHRSCQKIEECQNYLHNSIDIPYPTKTGSVKISCLYCQILGRLQKCCCNSFVSLPSQNQSSEI